MASKLRVNVGWKEEEEIKLPIYRNVPIEDEFVKVFRIMETMLVRLDKVEILLAFYLVNQMDYSGLVYSNKIFRDRFIKHIEDKSKGKIQYRHQTVYQAFSNLRKEGILVPYKTTNGAYFVNPAFIHIGDKQERRNIFATITKETENEIIDII